MFNLDNNLTNADWVKQSWDLQFKTLPEFFAYKNLVDSLVAEQRKELKHFMELPVYEVAPTTFKNQAQQFLSNETTKALRQNPTWQPNDGVPSALEIARALSRLEILPNPPIPNIDNPEKYVESPWQVVATPTIDPNLWDDAELELVDFNNLYATDKFLSRKKIRKHVEVLGQAVTQFRSHALVAVVGDRYTIIDGHHRLMSQWLLGQQKAPVWVIRLKEENAATTR